MVSDILNCERLKMLGEGQSQVDQFCIRPAFSDLIEKTSLFLLRKNVVENCQMTHGMNT
jgi:hypothetical protein